MNTNNKLILNKHQIELKITRMAFQIWEENANCQNLIMIGIAENGYILLNLLADKLEQISPLKIQRIKMKLNKKNPLSEEIKIEQNLDGQSVVLIDDVSNSGKVMLYALRPITAYIPQKISLAVLVDRKHKSYPAQPNIVGHSLSTTLQDNITVQSENNELVAVYLD